MRYTESRDFLFEISEYLQKMVPGGSFLVGVGMPGTVTTFVITNIDYDTEADKEDFNDMISAINKYAEKRKAA